MAISALRAGKYLCEISDWSLTNLSLQKLLYIAHMVYLGTRDEPFIKDSFEAWDYGPVLPSLYHQVKVFGSAPIRNIFRSIKDIPDKSESAEWLDEAYDALGDMSSSQLVAITHRDKGAWAKHYKPGVHDIVIPNEDIKAEYNRYQRAS